MSNYPDGMSYHDYIAVGEYSDPDAMPDWFAELITNEDWYDDAGDLWGEFLDETGPEGSYTCSKSSAQEFLENRYPAAVELEEDEA